MAAGLHHVPTIRMRGATCSTPYVFRTWCLLSTGVPSHFTDMYACYLRPVLSDFLLLAELLATLLSPCVLVRMKGSISQFVLSLVAIGTWLFYQALYGRHFIEYKKSKIYCHSETKDARQAPLQAVEYKSWFESCVAWISPISLSLSFSACGALLAQHVILKEKMRMYDKQVRKCP